MTHMPGLAPAIRTMRRAMRLCRFHFSTAAATQITPTSSSVVFLKYSPATCGGQGGSPRPDPAPSPHPAKLTVNDRLAGKKQGDEAYLNS